MACLKPRASHTVGKAKGSMDSDALRASRLYRLPIGDDVVERITMDPSKITDKNDLVSTTASR
jgi:hypothetical protein